MDKRIRNLRLEMKKKKIDALFITNLLNIRYLTGLSISSGSMIVTSKTAELFLDQRYLEMATERAKFAFSIIDTSRLKESLLSLPSFGFEAETVSVEQYNNWKRLFKNKKLVQTLSFIKGLRRFKDQKEISLISTASRITKSVLKIIPTFLESGVTETAVATMIEEACRKLGADGMAFDTIVAFGSNTSRPHHHPTEREFKTGDLVQIDMGAKFGGYCSDYSRVYVTGDLSSDQKKAIRALKKAKKSVEKLIRPGASIHSLDRHAREVLKEEGYDTEFCHALGHGVGLEIHEGVTISTKRPDALLRKGDVITIEPGLYFPGKFGIRIEDTHIVR